ncbi:hypothetical protein LP52_13570 [Streptomonospora alba]|uniref:Uncharacterized protein n=1 Tax=Streptomonospora alba TaxID=183763 RepID=A0A0C2JNP1_9ACTN|nr:hypothetical protein LP52_13570 [Streptomonospora alba]
MDARPAPARRARPRTSAAAVLRQAGTGGGSPRGLFAAAQAGRLRARTSDQAPRRGGRSASDRKAAGCRAASVAGARTPGCRSSPAGPGRRAAEPRTRHRCAEGGRNPCMCPFSLLHQLRR